MNRAPLFPSLVLWMTLATGAMAQIPRLADEPGPGDAALADYLRHETAVITENCLSNVKTLEDWTGKRDEYRRQLQEMLGLWPMPERTALKPVVTGRLERDDFTVEKLYFEASPGLYCTANLYLPKPLTNPAPTILYECGHIRVTTNGVSPGNKAFYQTDGAWYARNGYVCLVLDTLQLGELPGIHTGTRNLGMWWWNSRGYTPAGVEAWFGIRALDYLCTRPEVDTNRFGITGHSGGGAYSWTITALDDRIKVAAPLAGMTEDQSHICDGVIDSHCDCNFFVNIYRWDYPLVAALAAPRPLLIGGTDRDQLFHLDNTVHIFEKVQHLYSLYGNTTDLALAIAPGPHMEAPELQVAVMRWFNRYLKGEDPPVETAPKKFFAPPELKVFGTSPPDAINTNVQEVFVPMAKGEAKSPDELRSELRDKTFTGWPNPAGPLEPKPVCSVKRDGVRFSAWDFSSQQDVQLRLYLLESATGKTAEEVELEVLDPSGWTNWLAAVSAKFAKELGNESPNRGSRRGDEAEAAGSQTNPPPHVGGHEAAGFERLKGELTGKNVALAFLAPRGVGLTAWSGGEKRLTQIRRRFMLLGQTVDGMRVWDIRRAVQTIQSLRPKGPTAVTLHAEGPTAVNALYAALFEPAVDKLDLGNLPKSHMDANAPDYLNVLKITDIPEVKGTVAAHAEVKLETP